MCIGPKENNLERASGRDCTLIPSPLIVRRLTRSAIGQYFDDFEDNMMHLKLFLKSQPRMVFLNYGLHYAADFTHVLRNVVYRARVATLIQTASTTFPYSQMVWRTTADTQFHSVDVSVAWQCRTNARIRLLRQEAALVLSMHPVIVFPFHHIVNGRADATSDNRHYNPHIIGEAVTFELENLYTAILESQQENEPFRRGLESD